MAAFELAREALAFLEQHRLPPSEVYRDLAARYLAAPGSPLAREIDAATDGGLRLTAADATRLVDLYCRDRSDDILWREHRVARQADALGSLAAEAHDVTRALGADLGAAQATPADTDAIVARLVQAERELADLRAELALLRDTLASGAPRRDNGRDELTAALDQAGGERLLQEVALSGRSYVMVLFATDALVGINARYGRSVGNNVLSAFAATLRQSFPDEELIRWSGNEFIVVMRDVALIMARARADEALRAFHARRLKLRGSGETIDPVTASVGIVVGRGDETTASLEQARLHLAAARDRVAADSAIMDRYSRDDVHEASPHRIGDPAD
ncbi:GGDEF domain-containing protein [Sphingomonas sp. CV7422]|uniref:GGDEF domain-containing protein n=1 Tax=Sphingomonas sp. CV7422 TaxID=3018036 RepID=UPI0022FF2968|nr:diguanylate cyclase [Sphingomonas sp. CV7422]